MLDSQEQQSELMILFLLYSSKLRSPVANSLFSDECAYTVGSMWVNFTLRICVNIASFQLVQPFTSVVKISLKCKYRFGRTVKQVSTVTRNIKRNSSHIQKFCRKKLSRPM